MDVAHISFNDLKAYWIEVDHFRDTNKKIHEVVRHLGPYSTRITNPRRFSYGLFEGSELVGVTHLVQWSDALVRYRTLNIRASHRGNDLGLFLLSTAINMDWGSQDQDLFGWIRRDHQPWGIAHGFEPLDGSWHDDHIAMTRPLSAF